MLKSSLGLLIICLWAQFLEAKKNIVVILSDEESITPHGWEEVIDTWAQEELPARQMLKKRGKEFKNAYANATACVPARGVFYTGQDPEITELKNTNGMAKQLGDPRMTELAPKSVPTVGHWLQEAGYDEEKLSYFGKFHLADRDLYDEKGKLLQTLSPKFKEIPENIQAYRDAKVLKDFGFPNEWFGPEPHGPDIENDGFHRDPIYVREFQTFINQQASLREDGDERPFVSFVNLVNPHDIVLMWKYLLDRKLHIDQNAPIPPVCRETDVLDLSFEASVHKDYQYTYKKMYCWIWAINSIYKGEENINKLRQFYYGLLKKSDEHLMSIINILKEANFYDDTIIIFSSDHGDYLGRRGGQQQKWHGLFEEIVHVPLFISGPGIKPGIVKQFVGHVDVLPTILGLLNIDANETLQKLENNFTKALPLLGRDLSGILFDDEQEDFSRVVYSRTEDDISHGKNNYALTWYNLLPRWMLPLVPFGTFKPIQGSRFVESIRFYERGKRWSFMRYWDPDGKNPDVYRLYNLDDDGFEVNNLLQNFDSINLLESKIRDHERFVTFVRYKTKLKRWREFYRHI